MSKRSASAKGLGSAARSTGGGALTQAADPNPNPNKNSDANPDSEQATVRQLVASRFDESVAALEYVLSHNGGSRAQSAQLLRSALKDVAPEDARVLRRALKHATLPRAGTPKERLNPQQPMGLTPNPVLDWTPNPTPDQQLVPHPKPGQYPYRNRLSTRSYEAQHYRLQVELLKMARWVKETGQRIVILFEGRDTAGKGGTIKRFMEHLNPRGARVVALDRPSELERGQWYFQRYVQHLPTTGEIVLFDRSWYNRAGVEHVMGFCTDNEYETFMGDVPAFEQQLCSSGVRVVKFWFSVSRSEQRRRFKQRENDPLKQWKLSVVDAASLHKWHEYTQAKLAMFATTDSEFAPWVVINADCKKRARLNAMRYVLNLLPYTHKDIGNVGAVDPLIVGRVAEMVKPKRTRALGKHAR